MRNNIFITFCSMVQFSLLEIHIYHQEKCDLVKVIGHISQYYKVDALYVLMR